MQQLPRELRIFLMIDGEELVEIDIVSSHPRIAYRLERQILEGDAYDLSYLDRWVPGDRAILKLLIMVALNAESRESAYGALLEMFRPKTGKKVKDPFKGLLHKTDGLFSDLSYENLDYIMDQVSKKHPCLEKYWFSDAWEILMKKEADIMTGILLECKKEGIKCLPVHDSILVHRSKADKAQEIMHKEWNKRLGEGLETEMESRDIKIKKFMKKFRENQDINEQLEEIVREYLDEINTNQER